jgi:aspartate/methionine/tyrosine aminotransferase
VAKKQPPIFREVPYMGVIYVVAEAVKLGFRNGHPDWCNLGQGQPEIGPIPGSPTRLSWITLEPHDHAYGPVGGIDELKEAVAAHYNRLYRQGADTMYKKENVSIASGGRLMLMRILATLGEGPIGYQVPDYTAYEDMLDYHRHRVKPVPVPTTPAEGFKITPDRLGKTMVKEKLRAFLMSNPCNPTGQLIRDAELKAYVNAGRKNKCALIMDEFYSHFIYGEGGEVADGPVSAASHVKIVEKDQVILVDGLTKSFRYPGWRLGWAVGPSEIIENINRAASAIDGGPSLPAQRLAIKALEPARADQETDAVRRTFARKRNLMLEGLRGLGIECEHEPSGTFYVWANIKKLKKPFNDADEFFRAALAKKVMTVPGRFFDVNPGGVKPVNKDLKHWVRFSFGPPEAKVRMGLERLEEMLQAEEE